MTKLRVIVHNCFVNATKKLLVTKYVITLHTEPITYVITALNLSAWLLQPEVVYLTTKVWKLHRPQANNKTSNEYLIANEVLTMKFIMQVNAVETRKHFLCCLNWNCRWDFLQFLFYITHTFDSSALSANTWMIICSVFDSIIYNSHFLVRQIQFLWCIQNYFIKNRPSLCTKNSEVLVCVSKTCHTVLKAWLSWHALCHISFWKERIWNQTLFYVNNSTDTVIPTYLRSLKWSDIWNMGMQCNKMSKNQIIPESCHLGRLLSPLQFLLSSFKGFCCRHQLPLLFCPSPLTWFFI